MKKLMLILVLLSMPVAALDFGKALKGLKDKNLNLGGTSEKEEISIGREITGNLLGAAPCSNTSIRWGAG
jgi:uncharacterized protein with gpF-like domain